MKGILIALALAVVLLSCSTAQAAWVYPAPVVVQSYYRPVVPVYAYPRVVAMPVVTAPVVTAPVVYPAPVVVRSRVYYYGQPVRNVVRWATPY